MSDCLTVMNGDAVLLLGNGELIWLNQSGLEYWDLHLLPFGAVIIGDRRHLIRQRCETTIGLGI